MEKETLMECMDQFANKIHEETVRKIIHEIVSPIREIDRSMTEGIKALNLISVRFDSCMSRIEKAANSLNDDEFSKMTMRFQGLFNILNKCHSTCESIELTGKRLQKTVSSIAAKNNQFLSKTGGDLAHECDALTVRACNVLLNNAKTEPLIDLTVKRILGFSNCGRDTADNIVKCIKSMYGFEIK